MKNFLQLPEIRRRSAFLQVNEQIGLQALSVEKDFWVCWTLRELFTLPKISGHLTFKGGTSLSKAWKLIHRFSEDIDLVVDKELLGFGGDRAPDQAPSKKQRKERLEQLMESTRTWVLYCLIQAGVGTRALFDLELFKRVASHREMFFRYSWVDYSTHKPGTFRLLPPEEHLATWRADYQAMLGPMFFSDTPTFEELMTAAREFQKSFNATAKS